MYKRTMKFRDIDVNTVFNIKGEDVQFVKRELSNGYNAFNLETGTPYYFYGEVVCEVGDY